MDGPDDGCAGLSVVVFVPFGLVLDLYTYPHLDLHLGNTLPVLAAATALACVASVGGAWAWNLPAKGYRWPCPGS